MKVVDDFIYHGRGGNLCLNIGGRSGTDRDRKILLITRARGLWSRNEPAAASQSARKRLYRISRHPRVVRHRNDKRPRRGGGIRYVEVHIYIIMCIYIYVNNI